MSIVPGGNFGSDAATVTVDAEVLAALARWPNVPDVFGWVRLDMRGQWHLGHGPVRHPGLAAFLSRNYVVPSVGSCFVQNGPQRAFVTLDYTPWVLRCDTGELRRHTGDSVSDPKTAWIDQNGSVLIAFEDSIGVLDDRDLAALIPSFRGSNADGNPDSAVEEFLAAPETRRLWLALPQGVLPVGAIRRETVPGRYGFDPMPQPPAPTQPRP
ncbi:MAG: DUF2946 family protein [Zoogloeaceae bacterium]|nr:DUF2946 family protein [Zoogloeaceae bacterium]